MIARITQHRINPAENPTVTKYGSEVFVPGSKAQDGFRGVFGCCNGEGQWFLLEIYDSIEQARATETRGWYQQMVEGLEVEDQKGQVRRNFYELAVAVGLEGLGDIPANEQR